MTTLAAPRSLKTSVTSVYHAQVDDALYHCRRGRKIQGQGGGHSDSLRPSSPLTPHAALMTVAHLRFAFPIVGVESLEESHPSRLPP